MKKLFALIFALVFAALALASCGTEPGKNDPAVTTAKTGEDSTTAESRIHNLPDNLDFDRTEIRFLTSDPDNGIHPNYNNMSVGNDNYTPGLGSRVEDTVFVRNAKIEEELNVVISNTMCPTDIMRSNYLPSLMNGDAEYDVIVGYQIWDVPLALKGFMLNFQRLKKYNANYIDTKADYWATDYNNALSFQDATFWLTGDLNLRFIGGGACTFFNTALYSNALAGTYGNLYSLVRAGKWTWPLLREMCLDVYDDKGTEDKADDIVGYVWSRVDESQGVACGVHYTEPDPAGNPMLTATHENEILMGYFDILNQICYKDACNALDTSKWGVGSMTRVGEGKALFCSSAVMFAGEYLADVEDYGILPPPKLNETQKKYQSLICDNLGLYGIYAQCDRIPATAATLEAMCAYGAALVKPVYYEDTLKYRYTRDPDSAEMVDLIHDNVYIDFLMGWCMPISGDQYLSKFAGEVVPNPTASGVMKWETIWEEGLVTVTDKLMEIVAMADAVK